MGKTVSVMNTPLKPDEPAIPCGWFDTYYPSGRLEIVNVASGEAVEVVTSGIGPREVPREAHNSGDLRRQWVNLES